MGEDNYYLCLKLEAIMLRFKTTERSESGDVCKLEVYIHSPSDPIGGYDVYRLNGTHTDIHPNPEKFVDEVADYIHSFDEGEDEDFVEYNVGLTRGNNFGEITEMP